MDSDNEYGDLIRERFAKLPKVLQDAITSADVSAHMRELAEKHKLHLDQWDSLENEVQLTLLGAQPADQLAGNIEKEVGVDAQTAAALAQDVFKVVFEPIREELERELEHPNAIPTTQTPVQTAGAQAIAAENAVPAAPIAPLAVPAVPQTPAIVPATPPAAPVQGKVERAPLPPGYVGQASHERKTIEGDPYREQIA